MLEVWKNLSEVITIYIVMVIIVMVSLVRSSRFLMVVMRYNAVCKKDSECTKQDWWYEAFFSQQEGKGMFLSNSL